MTGRLRLTAPAARGRHQRLAPRQRAEAQAEKG